jgi:DNA-binding MarR family transcriptional regulator
MAGARPLPFDPVAEAHRQWVEHGWAGAADGMAAVTSLMRAQQIVSARVEEVLRPYALTFARYEVLMLLLLSRRGALPMARIGERLQVHPASVTNAVDRLEAQGFVRRTPHPTDRRTTLVEITDDGRSVASKATDDLNEHVFGRPGLTPDGVERLIAVLTELRAAAGDF